MRRLLLREADDRWMTDDIFDRLLAASTGGLVCPTLRSFTCYLTETNPRFILHFLSPHLTHLTIRVRPFYHNTTRNFLPDLGPVLQTLPTRCLQEVTIDFGMGGMDHLKSEAVSVIQRCGHLLRVLSVPIPLGEAAVHHVMELKNLRVWDCVYSPPPTTSPLSAPFPPLQSLVLGGKDAYGWIPWLVQRERGIPGTGNGPVQRTGLKVTLTHLAFQESVPINTAFISPLFLFPNLVTLDVQSNCWSSAGCTFSLANQDVVQLSAALPLLELLELGHQCPYNTCHTTISCFLALSVHCKGLYKLGIHLNATNLIDNIRSLSEDPNFRDLRSLPTRCPLRYFNIGSQPFPPGMSSEDVTLIAAGFVDIFPSLLGIHPHTSLGWNLLHSRVRELRGLHTPSLPYHVPPQV